MLSVPAEHNVLDGACIAASDLLAVDHQELRGPVGPGLVHNRDDPGSHGRKVQTDVLRADIWLAVNIDIDDLPDRLSGSREKMLAIRSELRIGARVRGWCAIDDQLALKLRATWQLERGAL